jgi:hypothetical protein
MGNFSVKAGLNTSGSRSGRASANNSRNTSPMNSSHGPGANKYRFRETNTRLKQYKQKLIDSSNSGSILKPTASTTSTTPKRKRQTKQPNKNVVAGPNLKSNKRKRTVSTKVSAKRKSASLVATNSLSSKSPLKARDSRKRLRREAITAVSTDINQSDSNNYDPFEFNESHAQEIFETTAASVAAEATRSEMEQEQESPAARSESTRFAQTHTLTSLDLNRRHSRRDTSRSDTSRSAVAVAGSLETESVITASTRSGDDEFLTIGNDDNSSTVASNHGSCSRRSSSSSGSRNVSDHVSATSADSKMIEMPSSVITNRSSSVMSSSSDSDSSLKPLGTPTNSSVGATDDDNSIKFEQENIDYNFMSAANGGGMNGQTTGINLLKSDQDFFVANKKLLVN